MRLLDLIKESESSKATLPVRFRGEFRNQVSGLILIIIIKILEHLPLHQVLV